MRILTTFSATVQKARLALQGGFAKQSFILLAAGLVVTASLYAFRFYAMRQLGVSQYGTLAALLSVGSLVAEIAIAGTVMVANFTAAALAVGDNARLHAINRRVSRTCLIIVVVGLLLAFAIAAPAAGFLHVRVSDGVIAAIFLASVVVALALFRGFLQGTQRFTWFSLSQIAESSGKALLGACAIAIGLGVRGAVTAFAIAGVLALIFTVLSARLVQTSAESTAVKNTSESAYIRRGIGTILTFSLLALLIQIDPILAKHYLPAHEAGIYAAAILPGRALATLMTFLPTLILPKATARSSVGASGASLLLGVLGIAFALSAIALAFFYAFSSGIIGFVSGSRYLAAAQILFPAGCAATLWSLSSIVAAHQIGFNRFFAALTLAGAVAFECAGMILFHGSAAQIIYVLLSANAVGFLASLLCVQWRTVAPSLGEAFPLD